MNIRDEKTPSQDPEDDFGKIGALLESVRHAGGNVPARFFSPDSPDLLHDAALVRAALARNALDSKIRLVFSIQEALPDLTSKAVAAKRTRLRTH